MRPCKTVCMIFGGGGQEVSQEGGGDRSGKHVLNLSVYLNFFEVGNQY